MILSLGVCGLLTSSLNIIALKVSIQNKCEDKPDYSLKG
jgi:hypothetical protein